MRFNTKKITDFLVSGIYIIKTDDNSYYELIYIDSVNKTIAEYPSMNILCDNDFMDDYLNEILKWQLIDTDGPSEEEDGWATKLGFNVD